MNYMKSEQIEYKPIDKKDDIYNSLETNAK